MQSLNHVILSVDEKAAYKNGSFYIRADLGMAYDNVIQYGKVVACPKDLDIKEGDVVHFHHLLIDDKLSNIEQEEFNWDFKQVFGKAYVCPRKRYDHTFENRLIAKEVDGELHPLFSKTYVEEIIDEPETFLIVPESAKKPQKSLAKVIRSNVGLSGTIIIKTDSAYPLKEGDKKGFVDEENVLGVYQDGKPTPKDGITFIKALDEGGYEKIGGIYLKKKYDTISKKLGYGEVIDTTHEDLSNGDRVLFKKGGTWNRVEINEMEPFWAIKNELIEGIVL